MEEQTSSGAGAAMASSNLHARPGTVIQPPASMEADLAAAAQAKTASKPNSAPSAAATPSAVASSPTLPPIPPIGMAVSEEPPNGSDPDHPMPVASTFSTYGMEYIIMFIALAVAATSFVGLVDAIISIALKD